MSLTSQICKLFESVVRDFVSEHLERNSLIRSTQHGFSRDGSCLSNLLEFLDKVIDSLDNNDSTDVIYFDIIKAFDKVPHHRLLDKIEQCGTGGKVLALYKRMATWEEATCLY